MHLYEFRDLIANMPLSYQAFTSKRSTWAPHIDGDDNVGNALRSIFGQLEEVTISRYDLCEYANFLNLEQFVIATIVWGYPAGMRGKNFAKFADQMNHLVSLMQLLSTARNTPIADWIEHFTEVRPIRGIGLSTYTKFLNFLSVLVEGQKALILDDRIMRIANLGLFDGLAPLYGLDLKYSNAHRFYLRYLNCIHGLAEELNVSAEKIEFFLFEFGLNLKEPPAL
jgi:hypothetical protein